MEGKTIYFPILLVFGGHNKHWGGCFRYLLSTKGTFLLSNASRPPPFILFIKKITTNGSCSELAEYLLLKKE
jgi:hypothetical protein